MANTKIPSELVAINAISGTLIADNAITSVHIAENNITATQIAINAVTALQMADGTITSAKIADGTIVTADIADGQISTAKLVDSSVTQAKIGSGAVVASSIANGTITSTQMGANSVSTANIQDNAINLDKMAGLTRGSIIYGNAAGNPAYLAAGTNGHVLTSDGTDISWTADTDLFLATAGGTITGDLTISEATPTLKFTDTDNNYDATISGLSGSLVLIADSGAEFGTETIQFHTGGSSTLTLDASQNATFSGSVITSTLASPDGTGIISLPNTGEASFARGAVFNENSHDSDFRVESNANTHMLFVDAGNNRVGINSSSPSEALQVIGNIGLYGELKLVQAIRHANSGAQVIDNDNDTYFILNDPEGANRIKLGDSGDAANTYRNTTHKFEPASGTEYMRINATGVGIGTTNPAEKLQVKGAIGFEPSNSTNRWSAYTYTDNTFRLNYNGAGADEFLIKSDGNVGIRNTNPAATLEVGTLTSGSTGNVIINSEGGNPPALQVKSRTNRARINIQDNDTSGYIIAEGSVISIGFADAVSDNNININSSHDVGIGTDTPVAKLHIQDNTSTVYDPTGYQHDLFIEKRNTAGNNQVGTIRFAVTGHDGSTTAEASIGVLQTSNAHSGNLVFGTRHSGTRAERMRITSDGNVGIGATSVDELLHLQKSSGTTMVKTEVAANSTVGFEIQKTGPTTSNWRIVDGQTVNGSLEIYDVTDSRQVMVFDGEGDIGMGVTPATHAKLTLGGTRTSYSSVLAFDNNTTGGATFFMLASDNTWSAGGNKFLMGHGSPSSSAVDVAIDADGKVGIGATSPGTNLHIGAGTAGENLGVKLNRGATTNFFVACDNTKQAYIGVDNSNSYIKLGSLSNHDVAISQNNAHAIYIDTNKKSKFYGNVELADGKPIFSETDNGTHQYSHLCTGSFYQGSNQGVAINTNIPSYNVSGNNMFMFTIKGYVYDNTGGGIIDCCIGTYSGEGAFHNNSYTAQNIPKQWQGKIRLAYNSSNKVVVLLGDTDTTTNYEIAVDCAVQGFNGVDPAYFTGWTMSHFTSTSAYSGITTVKPKETQLIGFEAYSTGFTKTSGWSQISANMSTESFDFGGYYNTSNGRFTPLVAGLYQFNVGGYSSYADSTGSARYAFAISKNGSLNRIAGGNFCAGDSPLVSITKNVYLNGTSDYVELRMYSAIGGSGITVGHSSHPMWWEGYLISPSRGDTTWTI